MPLPARRAAPLFALSVAIALSACGAPATPDAADAATSDMAARYDLAVEADLATGADLAPSRTVACGNDPCSVPAAGCCSATFGASGSCVTVGQGCPSPAAQLFDCDGPEDCLAGEVCCYRPQVGAKCSAAAACDGNPHGSPMCHDDPACGAQRRCCALGKLAPYRACSPLPCVL
jgi:hypothetical protein